MRAQVKELVNATEEGAKHAKQSSELVAKLRADISDRDARISEREEEKKALAADVKRAEAECKAEVTRLSSQLNTLREEKDQVTSALRNELAHVATEREEERRKAAEQLSMVTKGEENKMQSEIARLTNERSEEHRKYAEEVTTREEEKAKLREELAQLGKEREAERTQAAAQVRQCAVCVPMCVCVCGVRCMCVSCVLRVV